MEFLLSATLESGVKLVRPLLSFSREQIRSYLEALGQEYLEDPSNADPRYLRNRIRHQLLPLLAEQYNPAVSEALIRLGTLCGEMTEALAEPLAELRSQAVVSQMPNELCLKVEPFQNQPAYLVRQLLVKLWEQQGWPRQQMGQSQWQRIADLLTGGDGSAVDLPGKVHARRSAQLLWLSRPGQD